jgi:hypothetical protein
VQRRLRPLQQLLLISKASVLVWQRPPQRAEVELSGLIITTTSLTA